MNCRCLHFSYELFEVVYPWVSFGARIFGWARAVNIALLNIREFYHSSCRPKWQRPPRPYPRQVKYVGFITHGVTRRRTCDQVLGCSKLQVRLGGMPSSSSGQCRAAGCSRICPASVPSPWQGCYFSDRRPCHARMQVKAVQSVLPVLRPNGTEPWHCSAILKTPMPRICSVAILQFWHVGEWLDQHTIHCLSVHVSVFQGLGRHTCTGCMYRSLRACSGSRLYTYSKPCRSTMLG